MLSRPLLVRYQLNNQGFSWFIPLSPVAQVKIPGAPAADAISLRKPRYLMFTGLK